MDEIRRRRAGARRAALVPFTDGSSLTVNSPFWIAGQEKVPPRPAPDVGQHSGEILREAGYPEAEIRALRDAGVIAWTP